MTTADLQNVRSFPDKDVYVTLKTDEEDELYFHVRHAPGVQGGPPLVGPPPVLVRLPGTDGFQVAGVNKKNKVTEASPFLKDVPRFACTVVVLFSHGAGLKKVFNRDLPNSILAGLTAVRRWASAAAPRPPHP